MDILSLSLTHTDAHAHKNRFNEIIGEVHLCSFRDATQFSVWLYTTCYKYDCVKSQAAVDNVLREKSGAKTDKSILSSLTVENYHQY